MNQQLTIFDQLSVRHDSDRVSCPDIRHDKKILKQQAIARYLDRVKLVEKPEPVPYIEEYSPGRRQTKYCRLCYQPYIGKKIRIHIKGGAISSELTDYRRQELQKLIDRGAELAEILAQLATFNGGSKTKLN